MSQLPKEWEAIIAENTIGCAEHVCDRVRNAVSSAYALSQKPQRELTDAEIQSEWGADNSFDTRPFTPRGIAAIRRILAAHQRKQTEPEKVKFRAARIKKDASGEPIMLHAELVFDENSPYEWLDIDGKPQEYEVTLP